MMSRFPHTLLIIVGFIVLAGLATHLLPKGEYERQFDESTQREAVVPGSYHTVNARPLSPFEILVAIPRGIVAGGEVIALIFMVGACFYVIEKTGALKEGIILLTSRLQGKEEVTLVLTGLLFLTGGALEGMEEEVIPLIPVLTMLTRRLGYDAFVMVAASYGSTVIGASFSPLNPFGAVTAQKIAGLPFLHAGAFQAVAMLIGFGLWMSMIIRYGRSHKVAVQNEDSSSEIFVSAQHKLILVIVGMAFVILIIGLMAWGWSFNEMAAEFFVVALLAGMLGKLGWNGTCVAYVEGLREMTFAALIVGFAHGISLVLIDGKILDTIIYGLFIPMEGLPTALSSVGMMMSQFALHIVVPSYAGQAVLTIPILAPLSDLIGLSRQVCVLAFQYGAILMNMISPTNGALMAIIGLAGIGYDQWIRFAIRRLMVIGIFCAIALIVAGTLL
jgi:uncharacterized ion transporter superfamily protein YfcC